MGSLSSPLFWQIQFLVENLTKKNFKNNVAELNKLIEQYGEDARSFFLSCLIADVDFKDQRAHGGNQQKDSFKVQVLSHEMAQATTRPNFSSVVCQALEVGVNTPRMRNGGGHVARITEDYLVHFCRALRLGLPQQIAIAVGLVSSQSVATKLEAVKFLKTKVPEFTNSGAGQLSPDTLHSLLFIFRTHEEFLSNQRLTAQCVRAVRSAHPEAANSAEMLALLEDDVSVSSAIGGNFAAAAAALVNEIRMDDSLAELLLDLGYTATSSVSSFREFIKESGVIVNATQVAELVLLVLRSGSGLDDEAAHLLCNCFLPVTGESVLAAESEQSRAPTTWNANVIATVLREDYPRLSWDEVALKLDHPLFNIADQKELALFLSIYSYLSGTDFPVGALFRKWRYRAGQLSMLRQALAAPTELVNFGGPSGKQHAAFQKVSGINQGPANQAWRSLDVISTLLWLAETEHYGAVRALFDKPMRVCPEILLAGLAQIQSSHDALQSEIFAELLPMYFPPNHKPHSMEVVRTLWGLNRMLVIRGVVTAFQRGSSPALTQFIINLGTEVSEFIPALLDALPSTVAIPLVSLAADRDLVQLEMWLSGKLVASSDNKFNGIFAANSVSFLRQNFQHAQARPEGNSPPSNVPLSLETLVIFLRALAANQANLPENVQQSITELAGACVAAHPSLESLSGPNVEARANAYFSRIYSGDVSIPAVVEMLTQFKASEIASEREIFACMIHNLFDEYRFFHRYPEKELYITGVLFGNLIQHQLVASVTLGIALRYVLEALRNPNEQMVRFGVVALEQFVSRISEWPPYCHHVCNIEAVRELNPALYAKVEELERERLAAGGGGGGGGENAAEVAGQLEAPVVVAPKDEPVGGGNVGGRGDEPVPVGPAATGANGGASTTATGAGGVSGADGGGGQATEDVKEDGDDEEPVATPLGPPPTGIIMSRVMRKVAVVPPIVVPSDSIQDRVHFVINNISMQNLVPKVNELRAVMKSEYYSWIGHYLVVKRVSTQPNFHSVFVAMLRTLQEPELEHIVLEYTLRNIHRLLSSDKIVTESSERSLLKNLGLWLGQLTIARGKPLLQVKLDLKELLYNGYEAGRLIVTIPFVAKIMESAKNSKVFCPPNPWLMGLMGTMRALYDVPDLKMNICFEVEMLAKNLSLKMDDIKRSPGLEKRIPPRKRHNPDLTNKKLDVTIASDASLMPGSGAALQEAKREELVAATAALSGGRQTSGTAEGAVEAPTPSTQTAGPFPTGFQETTVIPNLAAYVSINPTLTLFTQHPQLKRVVPVAVDRAIREIIQPVVERSVTIGCITTRELILKDFSMESDEARVRKAAHLMVSNLAGSLALVTCKEPLRVSISNHLRTLLAAATNEQVLVEQVVQICSSDNLELGCMLIEKAATEKAMRDIDEQLASALTVRRKHAERREPFYDMSVFGNKQRYPSALPELLFPKPGGLQSQQLMVYDAFQRVPRQPQGRIPDQTPATVASSVATSAALAPSPPAPAATPTPAVAASVGGEAKTPSSVDASDALERYTSLLSQIDQMVVSLLSANANAGGRADLTLSLIPADHALHNLLREVGGVSRVMAPEAVDEASVEFGRKVFKRLAEGPQREPLLENILLAVLKILLDASKNVKTELTQCVVTMPASLVEEKRGVEIIVAFLANNLVNAPDIDMFLARYMDGGRKTVGVELATFIVNHCILKEHMFNVPVLANTIEMLTQIVRVAGKQPKYQGLAQVIDNVRVAAAAEEAAKQAGIPIPRPDPPGAREKVTLLLEHWLRVWSESPGSEKAYAQYLKTLSDHGVLQSDETIERFFRITCELVVTNCLGTAVATAAAKSNNGEGDGEKRDQLTYNIVDTYSKLIMLLVKFTDPNSTNTKINLLGRVLSTICQVLILDHSRRTTNGVPFDQRPYFRLLVTLLQELHAPDPVLDTSNYNVIGAFANAFYVLRPALVPGFAFAWLELISHRVFLPTVLLAKQQKGWASMHRLFMALFTFLEPQLRASRMSESMRILYKGVLRVLLVMLHDFPEFVCDYHFSFCDIIPPGCVHLRNLILSAFPKNMRLPDPFTPNLKVDLLPEISQPPMVLSNFAAALSNSYLREELDAYLKLRQPMTFLLELPSKLQLPPAEASATGCRYNIPLINSLVLYVGIYAINSSGTGTGQIAQSAPMDVFQQLASDLAPDGRYAFLNAIANQLRYPNNHTHYYSCVLLFLFSDTREEVVREQITRVLLERLIVHRPHPWGLLVTFIELIKNSEYNFWNHGFTRCAPEIERLFESVARSCMGPGTVSTGGNGGGGTATSGGDSTAPSSTTGGDGSKLSTMS